jgi:hypothetical protein
LGGHKVLLLKTRYLHESIRANRSGEGPRGFHKIPQDQITVFFTMNWI